MAPQASTKCGLLSPDHCQVGCCTSNGIDGARVLVSLGLWHDTAAYEALGPDRPSVPWSFSDRVSAWVVRPLHL